MPQTWGRVLDMTASIVVRIYADQDGTSNAASRSVFCAAKPLDDTGLKSFYLLVGYLAAFKHDGVFLAVTLDLVELDQQKTPVPGKPAPARP